MIYNLGDTRSPRTEQQVAHLQSGGTLHSFGLMWRNGPHEETSIQTGTYLDKEEGEQDFALSLKRLGYRKPRWFEYWRWGENRPSESVLEKMEALHD